MLNDYEQIASDVKRIYFEQTDEYAYVKPYLEQLKRDIQNAKQVADYVIAIIHNGGQYVEEVNPYSLYIAEKIREYGADIIIGHHQHIIQACDLSGGYIDRNETGKIASKQSFSIHTTMTDTKGLPIVVDSAEVYKLSGETHLKSDILHYANLFAGGKRYKEVQERYELI